jgi:hypothetical protein
MAAGNQDVSPLSFWLTMILFPLGLAGAFVAFVTSWSESGNYGGRAAGAHAFAKFLDEQLVVPLGLWGAAALVVVLGCFFVGFFVVGRLSSQERA